MERVINENYVHIEGWMIKKLKLKGNDLLVYAIIYGFSQLQGQEFNGSLQYLADWTNSSRQGIQKNLKSLLDKNLIKKKVVENDNQKKVSYYATQLHEVYNSVARGLQLSCTNNIEDNIYNISTTITTKEEDNIFDIIQNNFGRTLNSIEYETIQKWSEYNFPFDLLKYAVSKAVLKNIYNISYIDKILYEWNKNNIRTVAQAQKSDEEHENRKRNKSYKHHKTQREREEEAIAKFLSEPDD